VNKSIIAQRLKLARESVKLTQVDVYNRTGINNKTLSGYENDVSDPDLETLKSLAILYKCTTDYLIGHTHHPSLMFITQKETADHNKPKDLLKFLNESVVMFDGVILTEEDKEKVRKALELAFWDAKHQNKREKS